MIPRKVRHLRCRWSSRLLALAAVLGTLGVVDTHPQITGPATGVFVAAPSASSCTASNTFAANTTPAQINSLVTAAADPVVLCAAAGSYTWGVTPITLPLTKSVTLLCVTQGACNVAYSGGIDQSTFRFACCSGGTTTKLYRVSGFAFTANASTTAWLGFPTQSEIRIENFRADHNTFTFDDDDGIVWMASDSVIYLWGVFDHNTFSGTTTAIIIPFLFSASVDNTSPVRRRLGSAQNMFFEDNVLTIATSGFNGCHDAWGTSNSFVWRFNSITNCHMATHGTRHGYGPSNVEWYGNQMTINSSFWDPNGYRVWHNQGAGTGGLWGNHMTTPSALSASVATLQEYRSFEPTGAPDCSGSNPIDGNRAPTVIWQGYPCSHQPGRDVGIADNLDYFPMFAFKNIDDNTGNQFVFQSNSGGGPTPDYSGLHLQANRDFYNSVSATANSCVSPGVTCTPFNGTTGIGHGTLANRPNTCTTSTETGLGHGDAGVMYWATDQGSWNQSTTNPYGVQQNGADGVLYTCSATNTWTVYYTPYTYPHPLNVP